MDTAKAIWGALWPTILVVAILLSLVQVTWAEECYWDEATAEVVCWCGWDCDLGQDELQIPWGN